MNLHKIEELTREIRSLQNQVTLAQQEVSDTGADVVGNVIVYEQCVNYTGLGKADLELMTGAMGRFKWLLEVDWKTLNNQDFIVQSDQPMLMHDRKLFALHDCTIELVNKVEPVPWEDYDETNTYLTVYADISETEHQTRERIEAAEEDLEVLNAKVKAKEKELSEVLIGG